MSPQTAAQLDAALARLREEQARGDAPPPGEVSRADLARCGVSKDTIRNIEITFRSRLAAALLADPQVPHHLRRKLTIILRP